MLGDLASIFTRMTPYTFRGETIPCALCGSLEHDVVGRRDRYGHRLTTVLCRGCGLVFTNPMPTEAEIELYYRRHYRQHYHNAAAPRRKAIHRALKGARQRHAILAPLLSKGCRVLDVGAADGEFVGLLRREGLDATGIEPDSGFAEYARTRSDATILTTNWQRAEFPSQSFDLISAHHVLEHFRDPLHALARFHTWLKPEGHLYISVPDSPNASRTPYARFHFAHLYNFNHWSLVMAALRAGFAVEPRFGTQSTTLVFRRLPAPPAQWMLFPDNYALLARFFREHTNRKYFLSATPYRRWVRRMNRLGWGMVTAQFTATDRVSGKTPN